ncbi:DNA primase [Mycoplasmoides gallisepticum CA06_2006.052-5-2P]|uniref:DNA primase n=1 Tax=Mycoplasmoides gallisepticum WI01_2001.043-13-2P TaxID=1159201 RepID=J3T979_MYCGL|nr:DNA primase [Mycoplasmoides gallisepticum]AFP75972.1 DNA primase [Mycoplasmoides gallisepticum VA94_7994-1-7P]AFP76739.1 DNA primase [Mycoplasmoides gallisepticum NC95_13295-2-2P]AFP77493.1 DNA primase [Mycoplasmoides gallisepticum NC96_1596-4-2P]AFP78264.1 DNA primase [Mycoplasmoides gallisepticum NY01_2001.047-5-1P]AFP79024.1 DNA primase [Mycoplasmoides gallisepticum WI01_2001.043-13-2P]
MSNDLNQLAKYLRKKISVSSIISKYLDLEKKGSNYKSLCPFHDDNTPSFSVNDTKQVWKCFSCNESGGVIEFVQKKENLNFVEAVKKIVELEGIDLAAIGYSLNFNKQKAVDESDQEFYKLNQFLAWRAHSNLRLEFATNPKLNEFLNKRGLINEELLNNFQIGFHPKSYSLNKLVEDLKVFYQKHLNKTYDDQIILSNLRYIKYISEKNVCYFSNRVIFPIKNFDGQVVGFSGRAIDENNEIKYLNTPETDYFIKGHNLYNYSSLEFDENNSTIYLCEGYMDVIALYQIGIKNAVAIMGTALTDQQIELIKAKLNQIKRIVLALDNDESGKKATITCIKLLARKRVHNLYQLDYSDLKQKDLDEIYHSPDGENQLKELIKKQLSTQKEQENVEYDDQKQLSTQLYQELNEIKPEQDDQVDITTLIDYNLDKRITEQLRNFIQAVIKICRYYLISFKYLTYKDLSNVRLKILSKINLYKPTRYLFNTMLQITLTNQVMKSLTTNEQLEAILFCYNFTKRFLEGFTDLIFRKVNDLYLLNAKQNTLNDRIYNKIKLKLFDDTVYLMKKHIENRLNLDLFHKLKNELLSHIKYSKYAALAHDQFVNEEELNAYLKSCTSGIDGFKELYDLKTKEQLVQWLAKGEIFKLAQIKNLNILEELLKRK